MNRIDDQLIGEFRGVSERLRQEFGNLDSAVPVFVVPERRPASRRFLVIRLAVAATIAGLIAIAPTLTNRDNHSIVGSAAWAAMPTTLTAQQLAEIKNECQDIGQPASYEIAIADNRAERGFIILKADRGPDYKPTLNRYATIMCRYEMQDGVLTTPSIFLAETPSLGNAYSWGAEELGNQKVWIFLSSVEANVTKVEITTAQGMVLQASLTNGFTLAWWPRLAEAGADANATTNAFVRFYDSAGSLMKTFSMLTGQTTKP